MHVQYMDKVTSLFFTHQPLHHIPPCLLFDPQGNQQFTLVLQHPPIPSSPSPSPSLPLPPSLPPDGCFLHAAYKSLETASVTHGYCAPEDFCGTPALSGPLIIGSGEVAGRRRRSPRGLKHFSPARMSDLLRF